MSLFLSLQTRKDRHGDMLDRVFLAFHGPLKVVPEHNTHGNFFVYKERLINFVVYIGSACIELEEIYLG